MPNDSDTRREDSEKMKWALLANIPLEQRAGAEIVLEKYSNEIRLVLLERLEKHAKVVVSINDSQSWGIPLSVIEQAKKDYS